MINRKLLENALPIIQKHEGFRSTVYKDPVGIPTIGFGRNLRDTGISVREALVLLENDVQRVYAELIKAIPWICQLCEARQIALIDMGFNLGVPGLMKFKKFLEAMQRCDYNKAVAELGNSLWWKQVGNRAVHIMDIIKNGAIT